ncbi:RNA-directed DNA polymerase from mobile element jockey [Trichonephila clavipes]|nr:RNA-directed DNA polymerase from mobile element jockey [Trichonephila clavipes]
MDLNMMCPDKGLVLPTLNIDKVSEHARFLIISLPNNEMSQKSPFAIQKAIQGISGDPKSVKKLRSDDLLIEISSALQTKSFFLTKTFLNCPLTVNPHRSLNSSRGVISETDLLWAPETENLEGLSDQGVTQTDENITKIKCPPLKLLQPASSPSRNKIKLHLSISYASTQAHLLPSTFAISESQPPIPKCPIPNDVPSTNNNMITPIESSSVISTCPSSSSVQPPPPHLLQHLPN